MRILCYDSFATGEVRELIWLNAEFMSSSSIDFVRFYIREDRIAFALLLDPDMIRRPKEDYIL